VYHPASSSPYSIEHHNHLFPLLVVGNDVVLGVTGVAQDAKNRENVSDGVKGYVGHEEILAIATVFSQGVSFGHAEAVEAVLVPSLQDCTATVNEATALCGGILVMGGL